MKKKFIIIYSIVIFISIIIGIILSYFYNKDRITYKEDKWNSNKNLIDDRLTNDYPIIFIVSPSEADGYIATTVMCIYNDGKYVTCYYVADSMESYYKEASSETAFIDKLKDAYEDNINTEVANLLTYDLKPEQVRDAYLKQYKITDFSLESSVDMLNYIENPIYIYGVTYDDSLKGTSHQYYSENEYTTNTIKDSTGIEIIEWLMKLETESQTEEQSTE